jgi:hypothetical protein
VRLVADIAARHFAHDAVEREHLLQRRKHRKDRAQHRDILLRKAGSRTCGEGETVVHAIGQYDRSSDVTCIQPP